MIKVDLEAARTEILDRGILDPSIAANANTLSEGASWILTLSHKSHRAPF
jgi:hypothetical protein